MDAAAVVVIKCRLTTCCRLSAFVLMALAGGNLSGLRLLRGASRRLAFGGVHQRTPPESLHAATGRPYMHQ
jgi:hypothetical protein